MNQKIVVFSLPHCRWPFFFCYIKKTFGRDICFSCRNLVFIRLPYCRRRFFSCASNICWLRNTFLCVKTSCFLICPIVVFFYFPLPQLSKVWTNHEGVTKRSSHLEITITRRMFLSLGRFGITIAWWLVLRDETRKLKRPHESLAIKWGSWHQRHQHA